MRLENSFPCRRCRRQTLHAREVFSTGMGVLLTILTAGAFLPLWVALAVVSSFNRPWRCQQCGEPRAPLTAWLIMGAITLFVAGVAWLGYEGYIPPPSRWQTVGQDNEGASVGKAELPSPTHTHRLWAGTRPSEERPLKIPIWPDRHEIEQYTRAPNSRRPEILRGQAVAGVVEFIEPCDVLLMEKEREIAKVRHFSPYGRINTDYPDRGFKWSGWTLVRWLEPL